MKMSSYCTPPPPRESNYELNPSASSWLNQFEHCNHSPHTMEPVPSLTKFLSSVKCTVFHSVAESYCYDAAPARESKNEAAPGLDP
jgi:hypothetical protein